MKKLISILCLVFSFDAQAEMPKLNFGDVFVYEVGTDSGYPPFKSVLSVDDTLTLTYVRKVESGAGEFYVFEELSQKSGVMTERYFPASMLDAKHAFWTQATRDASACHNTYGFYGVDFHSESVVTSWQYLNLCATSPIQESGEEDGYHTEAVAEIPGPFPLYYYNTKELPYGGLPSNKDAFIRMIKYIPSFKVSQPVYSDAVVAIRDESNKKGNPYLLDRLSSDYVCANGFIGNQVLAFGSLLGAPCPKEEPPRYKRYISVTLEADGKLTARSTYAAFTYNSLDELLDEYDDKEIDYTYDFTLAFESSGDFDWDNVTKRKPYANQLFLVSEGSDPQKLAESVCTARYQHPTGGTLETEILDKYNSCKAKDGSIFVLDKMSFSGDCKFAEQSGLEYTLTSAIEFSLESMGKVNAEFIPLKLGATYVRRVNCEAMH